MFSAACIWHGKDKLGADLAVEGRVMAERLQLLGVPRSSLVESRFQTLSEDKLKVTSHAAWGCYGWLT